MQCSCSLIGRSTNDARSNKAFLSIFHLFRRRSSILWCILVLVLFVYRYESGSVPNYRSCRPTYLLQLYIDLWNLGNRLRNKIKLAIQITSRWTSVSVKVTLLIFQICDWKSLLSLKTYHFYLRTSVYADSCLSAYLFIFWQINDKLFRNWVYNLRHLWIRKVVVSY